MKEQEPTRRSVLQAGLAGTLLLGRGGSRLLAQGASTLPNIVYIHSHDSGRYLAPYGHAVPTPNLMRLARQGTLLRGMHAAAPTCSPSRAALLTGQSPHNAGMLGLAHLGWGFKDYNQHILHTLRKHGYTSTLAGLQHIAADPKVIGFDEILKPPTLHAADVVPGGVQFLERTHNKPFFLDIGFFETHREYPEPVDLADYILPPAPLPDVPETRLDMAGFHASARLLDAAIGRLLDALDKPGLRENTLIIYTTDHGISFPNMKCSLHDTGTAISMILRGPGVFSTPRVCDALLSNIDLFPTLCEYLKIEAPEWLQGKSFLPVLRKEATQVHEAVFSEVTYHAAYEPKRSVRTDRYKYIRRYDGRHHPNLPNCDDGGSKTYWLSKGWRERDQNFQEELYDLVFDPNEQINLAASPEHAVTRQELSARLSRWMQETSDPILRGPVPLPVGGRTVDPDALSPKVLNQP